MFMRLCTSLSLCLAAAAAVAVPVSSPAPAFAGTPPACVGADAHSFPLTSRIRGGPDSYEAGGGYGTWYLDLTNTTRRTCTGVHPVVVLVDDKRALKPDQPELEFYDGPRARPVTFESTDEHELVGVLDGEGFDGFAVPAGGTVSVKLRLALRSDVAADRVTATAAVVQRRGDDGDWVGESNAYRFGISGQDGADPPPDTTPDPTQGATPDPDGTQEGGGVGPSASGSPPSAPGTGTATATPDPSVTLAQEAQEAQEAEEAGEAGDAVAWTRELARTGPGRAGGLLPAAAVLLGAGAGALLLARRRR
ncbi:hypothetical protein [Streptomyces sp. NPDC053069]|uniref:hypothetical protein n=1 Tax=Streptomyces sp. NPDC053069 TaxID=3365695 RepID=UPI0037D61D08